MFLFHGLVGIHHSILYPHYGLFSSAVINLAAHRTLTGKERVWETWARRRRGWGPLKGKLLHSCNKSSLSTFKDSCVSVCMCARECRWLWKPREDVWSTGAGVTGKVQPPDLGAKKWTWVGPLQEEHLLLEAQPSAQPLSLCFKLIITDLHPPTVRSLLCSSKRSSLLENPFSYWLLIQILFTSLSGPN